MFWVYFNRMDTRLQQPEKLPIGIVIAGASGVGKSTVIKELRAIVNKDWIFPQRILSRKQRPDDDHSENLSVGKEAFIDLQANGEFHFSWQKEIAGETELYGFRKYKLGIYNVYSGNDAILTNIGRIRNEIGDQERLLVIRLDISDDVRRQRLLDRTGSNELNPLELEARLFTPQLEAEKMKQIDYTVLNDRSTTETAQKIISLVTSYMTTALAKI